MSDDAGPVAETQKPSGSRARQPAGLMLPPFGGWEAEEAPVILDPRRSLLALGVTHPGSTVQRVHAAVQLSQHHGNQFVQRALDMAELGRPGRPFFGRIQREAGVLARDTTEGGGGGTTTINPVANRAYTVTGRTLAEALTSIEAYASANDGEAGSVTWRPGWSLTRDDDGVVTACTVTVRITKTMPNWPGASRLSDAARAEWNRARGELDAHENRHVDLLTTNAEGMADVAIGLTEAEANAALSTKVGEINTINTSIDPFVTVLTTNIP